MIVFETGYTLPAGDQPLAMARILHAGNRQRIRLASVGVPANDTGTNVEGVNNALTYARWRVHSNQLPAPSDFTDAEWTVTGMTVGADLQTLTEDAATSAHQIDTAYTFAATEYVMSADVVRGARVNCDLFVVDSAATTHLTRFDLSDGTVVTNSGTAIGSIVDLGDDRFRLIVYFTAAAGAGNLRWRHYNGSASYAGDTSISTRVERMVLHRSSQRLILEGFGATAGDVFAIAAHNLGSTRTRVRMQHDSDDDDTYTTITGDVDPTDDSPILFIHEGVTSKDWRILIDRGVLPEIGVVRVGKLLQLQRGIYGGFAPSQGDRTTVLRGTISEGGEWLGRSRVRDANRVSMSWQNLTADWVRANLYGTNGLIRSLEVEPFFAAWRSSEYQDVEYAWTRGPVQPPTNQGVRSLMSWGLDAEVYGHE